MALGELSIRDIRKLASRYRQIANDLPADAKVLHKEMAKESYQDLRSLIQGSITKRQLRQMGHPFAKVRVKEATGRKVLGVAPILPINKQSGRLFGGLFFNQIRHGDNQAFEHGSSASHAKYIFDPRGTKKMIGRDLMTGHWFGKTTPGSIERVWKERSKTFNRKLRRKLENP